MKRSAALRRVASGLAVVVVAALVVVGLGGCGEQEREPAPSQAPPAAPAPAQPPAAEVPGKPPAAPSAAPQAAADAARAEAKQVFSTRCMTCHGPEGAGDGPAALGLSPQPRNFQDLGWQASVTDEHIEQIIKYGGGSVGKSVAMPPNPDLVAKPEVVTALREYVRSLRR